MPYRALCIIVDDMVDTGGTLDNAVRLLKGAGARKVLAFATHGRFSGGGEARVAEIPDLDCLVICNTLPHRYVCTKQCVSCHAQGVECELDACGVCSCDSLTCMFCFVWRQNDSRTPDYASGFVC